MIKTLVLAVIFMYSLFPYEKGSAVSITWKRLTDVQFARKLNKEVSMYFLYPTFGPSVNALKGKEIQIRGYMIPVDQESSVYVISQQPMSMCFFCGGAGPESIMELQLKNKRLKFKTDAVKTVRGRLELNPDDIEHLNYILKDAEIVD